MNDWAVIIVIYATLFISIPLIAILHELGHAFAYLLLTKPDKIDIYIGSYIKPESAIVFNAGKLNFYIKGSFPFVKGIGLCKSDKAETNYLKYIIILLAGPVFTFFVASTIGVIVLNLDVHPLIKISCYIILGISTLSLISNLVPKNIAPLYKVNLNNDGKQILFVLKIRGALRDFIEAKEHLIKNELELAILKFEKVLEMDTYNEKVLRLIVAASLTAKKYDITTFYIDKLESKYELTAGDLLQKGCLQSFINKHDEAIETYRKVLKKDSQNVIALNNMGYELTEKGAYDVAQQALYKAIKLKPEFDHPYSTLGYSKILQGEMETGKKLIDKCLQLNTENSYAYKALGIYYLKQKEAKLANENFDKAKMLNSDIDFGLFADELKQLTEQDIA